MGRPRGSLAPHMWKSGPDPVEHDKYVAWARARAQAHYRGEPWSMTWPEWQDLWRDHWHLRGRGPGHVKMTRRDLTGPWSRENTCILTPSEHARHHSAGKRGPRQKQ